MKNIEILKEYKALLDEGIITQEEFNLKKKSILDTPDIDESSGTIKNIGMNKHNETKYCSNCGAEVNESAVVCVKCGCAFTPTRQSSYRYEEDVPSVGLNVLSAFIPIVGLILYIIYHERTPIKAKEIGKWAIIGFVIGLVLYSLLLMV